MPFYLSLSLVCALGLALSVPGVAFADDEPVLSADIYRAVSGLRQDIGLNARCLASMGLSQAQAKTVLEAIVSWEASNRATLETARTQVNQADAQVREQMGKLSRGEGDSTGVLELESRITALASAKAHLSTVFSQAKSTALTSVSNEQRARLDTLEAPAPSPLDLTAVATRKQQLAALSELYRVHASAVAQAELEVLGADLREADVQVGAF